jgi:nucleotide-binding universal stress UspA family protein
MGMIPPRSILAAVDFSEPSRIAMEFAARLASQCGAALHVLHVQDPLLSAAARAQGLDLVSESRDELARFTSASAAARDRAPLHHHVVNGQGTNTICDIAEREQVDVIVLGMHGMSGPARALFGSTTEGVLRQANTPVFVVPDSWVPPEPSTRDLSGMGPVIAAIEISCNAMAGVVAGIRLAEVLNTTVHTVHVVPDLNVLERWRPHAETVVSQQIADARAEIAVALGGVSKGVVIPLQVETGPVAERLAAAALAAPGQHPILVLGRHARGSRRGVPGSTAYRVLALAKVPVLVSCVAEGCR